MGLPFVPPIGAAPPRRYEALAVVMEMVARGTNPSETEIGAAMRPRVSRARVRSFIDQLISEGLLERSTAGGARALRVRDVVRSRSLLGEVLRRLGWTESQPLGELVQPPCPHGHLPVFPGFDYLPDPD